MRTKLLVGFLALMILTGCAGSTNSSVPTLTASLPAPAGSASTLLHNSGGELNALNGVAYFEGTSNCTGTFIKTSEQLSTSAYLITSGRCVQQWQANMVFTGVLPAVGFHATFNYFQDTPEAQIRVPAKSIVYSTMKGQDVAIVQLDATVSVLQAQGIQPFAVANAVPALPTSVRVLGVPVTGIPVEEQFLRQEDCSMTGQVDLLELQWHFYDALRTTCRDIFGGSSGSPVFAGDSQEVFALINTTTVGGESPCALGAPCEVAGEGVLLQPDSSYAMPIVGVTRCFDENGLFIIRPDCPLDDGRQLELAGQPLNALQPVVTDSAGAAVPAGWNTHLSGEFSYYRYKTGPVSSVNCRDDAGYSAPVSLAEDNRIEDEIPEAEGFYYLCLVAGNNPTVDATWQPVQHATVVVAQIDKTPPLKAPIVSVKDQEGAFMVELTFDSPELVEYTIKFGPAQATDCSDPNGYTRYRQVPLRIIKQGQTPTRLCVIGYDTASNPTPPLDQVLGAGAPN